MGALLANKFPLVRFLAAVEKVDLVSPLQSESIHNYALQNQADMPNYRLKCRPAPSPSCCPVC